MKPSVIGTPALVVWSLPLRERGLKLLIQSHLAVSAKVAPPAGAWIETSGEALDFQGGKKSLPLRERGLKQFRSSQYNSPLTVAPPAGAWIETS